jgi:hypothetical protein
MMTSQGFRLDQDNLTEGRVAAMSDGVRAAPAAAKIGSVLLKFGH